MKRLTYLSVAEAELAEAALYYDTREPGLGRMFVDAVCDVTADLQQNPGRWAFVEPPVRGCRVWPYPYRLLYRELPDRLQIIAVVHLSRRPGYWKDRIYS